MLPVSSPISMLQAAVVFSSPNELHEGGENMDNDGVKEYFLKLDDLDDPVISTDSSKKRKIEDGEEYSSHSFT